MSSEDIQRNAAIHDGQRLGCSVNNDFRSGDTVCGRVVTDKGTELRILLQTADEHDPSSTDAKGYLSCPFYGY